MKINQLRNLGMNIVIKHKDKKSVSQYVEHLNQLRVEWVRLEFNFYEPESDELNDFLIQELNRSNIKILGLLTGLVPGNFITSLMPSVYFVPPTDLLEKYLRFCEYYTRRYVDTIHHWEIWNEENTVRFWIHNPNPDEYLTMVKEASNVIRNTNPSNKIVMGAIMGDDVTRFAPFQYMGFLQACVDRGIDEYIDIYNFHPYIPSCYVSRKEQEYYLPALVKAIEGFIAKYSFLNKPFWITEIGICPRWVKVSQEEIGKIYKDLYLYSLSKNIPIFFWVLTDFEKGEFYSRWNPEIHFGFLDFELKEKPLYTSFLSAFG